MKSILSFVTAAPQAGTYDYLFTQHILPYEKHTMDYVAGIRDIPLNFCCLCHFKEANPHPCYTLRFSAENTSIGKMSFIFLYTTQVWNLHQINMRCSSQRDLQSVSALQVYCEAAYVLINWPLKHHTLAFLFQVADKWLKCCLHKSQISPIRHSWILNVTLKSAMTYITHLDQVNCNS